MRQFIAIAGNAFMELIRQPVFLLLMTTSALFEVFLSCISYFGFGDEPKMVKISVLAVMLVAGLFSAVMSASASVAREIRSGTALAVLAKPVSRPQFLLAKYAGLALSLVVLTYVNCVAALLATRMAFDAYGDADFPGLAIFCGAVVVWLCDWRVEQFFPAAAVCVGCGAGGGVDGDGGVCGAAIHQARGETGAHGCGLLDDWRVVPASALILMALLVLAALALACSTRLEVVPTLACARLCFYWGWCRIISGERALKRGMFGRRCFTR